MSFTNGLREILIEYCIHIRNISDTASVKSLLTKVSENLRYELLASITDSDGDSVLTLAAGRGHRELCVTLLSSLPPADRLQLILVNKFTALHTAAAQGYTDTISGILNCLTADQHLQLLFTQDRDGGTAFHDAAQKGHTETVKTLLDNLTPDQQLKLLSVQNKKRKTATQHAAAYYGNSDTETALEHYQKEADYGVNFRKFAKYIAEISTIQIISASLHD